MAGMDRERWNALEPLLDRALDLAPAERESWLRDLREQSPALAAELVTLLSGESAADESGFLARPLDVRLDGLELGGYTLERPLGHGGMGSVWLARRTDGRFEGQAAVKLLNLALLSPAGQERFRREGSVLARLAHPGIARLLDAGVSRTGQPYLVLEHVDGERIDRFADAHGLAREERIRLFLQVLGAVGHAHANLIVHRDIKPSNILVTRDGAVKLLDFGIAKLLGDGSASERATLTAEGTRALTPEFASPEQMRGETITTATDVYSLGILLYILLSGRHPTSSERQTPVEAARALLEIEPARLGMGDLDIILSKALRKDPRERYQGVAELGNDLTRYLRHQPVSARRYAVGYRAGKFLRRNRAATAIASVVAAALIGATLFSLEQMREAGRQRDAALYASKRADAQVEFQSLLMAQLGDRPLTMREILDRSRAVLERPGLIDARVLPSILVQLSDRYGELGDRRIRGTLLARAESLAVALPMTEQLPEIRCDMADNYRTEGLYPEAYTSLALGTSMLRDRPDAHAEAICLRNGAQLDYEAGHSERSGPAVLRAIAIRDSLGETHDMFYVGLLSTRATSLDETGHHREALAAFQHALDVMDSSGRGGTIERAEIEHDLAVSLIDLGETAEAEKLLHDVLVRIASSDPAAPIPTQPLIHYGHAALLAGHPDSARKYFDRLVQQAVGDKSVYWQARGLFGLAEAELRLGLKADARRTTERFRRISAGRKPWSSDDQVTDVRMLDALLALDAGSPAVAGQKVTALLRGNRYASGTHSHRFHAALILGGEAALAAGRPDSALRLAREAEGVATLDSLTGTRSALVGEAMLVEARALLARGDTVGARPAVARAAAALRSGAGAEHPRTRDADALLAAVRR